MLFRKLFKYELKNILRSKTVLLGSFLLFVLTLSLIKISGDFSKSILVLFSALSVLVPLLAMLFASVYWYYSDRFTQLVLTMPLKRSEFFWARWTALVLALGGSLFVSLVAGFSVYSGLSWHLFVMWALLFYLVVIFISLCLFITIVISDRM